MVMMKEEQKTLIELNELMTIDEACAYIGPNFLKSAFNKQVAKGRGTKIGNIKYYSKEEINQWLQDKINKDPEQQI